MNLERGIHRLFAQVFLLSVIWPRPGHCTRRAIALGALAMLVCASVSAVEDAPPLDFSFTQQPPGRLVMIDGFRLHVDCQGDGPVTVLFEAGLGGSSLEWKPIQRVLSERSRACLYDRGGYGWSDRSPFRRDARQLAIEADQLLAALNVDGALILVGHSFGGFIIRLLAQRRADSIAGMVLVDASHEDQLRKLEKISGMSMMPRDASFVVSPVAIPQALPSTIQRQIAAFSRMRKTYSALHAEMRYFRQSAEQVRQARELMTFPVVVLRRGTDLYAHDKQGAQKTAAWEELQQDLARISTSGRVLVAERSGHHVHADQPELVVDAIGSLLDEHKD